MGLFSSAKAKLAAQKLAEEHVYELAAEEIAANNIRHGLYAKALAETDGNEDAARARYIKLRVETMKAEADLQDYASENAQKVDTELHNREEQRRREEAIKAANQPTGEGPDFTVVYIVIAIVFLYLLAVFSGLSIQ